MKSLIVSLALSLVSTAAFAFPVAPFDALKTKLAANSLLDNNNQAAYDFEGIIKLSNCSGALIRFAGQPATSKAYVLTNGHCYSKGTFGGMLKPNEIISNEKSNRSMKIFTKEMKLLPITATKVVYAAMTDTDVTLYEITQTYADIKKNYGIEAFDLDGTHPMIGMDIEIVSGYWEKGYSCAIDDFVFQLQEVNWFFKDSVRYTNGCDTIGGTSGSPIILKGTRHVVAINNTANEKGKFCEVNNPCEITSNGSKTSLQGKRYGQQTYNFYSCLTLDFKIDLSKSDCVLPKPQ
jgi:V8-like Glu-specific endopeptidase